ncbi:MAG: N-6 DNA methylase [Gammaproteobacteria bacterium]|nr:N-6 DNA methylase [Gammaproteobacteria bacterium]
MPTRDPNIAAHQEWLGFVRPTGLVVSSPALVQAGVILNRRDAEGQQLLNNCIQRTEKDEPFLPDFRTFAESVLGWQFVPAGYAGMDESLIPPALELTIADTGEVLRPTFAVKSEIAKRRPKRPTQSGNDNTPPPWQLLVSVCEPNAGFDNAFKSQSGGIEASPQSRMERLLRHTGTPAGLLFNGHALRLVSAPRGESAGWLDFRVEDMCLAAGRPICAAMRALLNQQRLLAVSSEKRLAALLSQSRKFQNEVSERLAEQVLHALYELLRGFQAAHHASKGELLGRALSEDPDHVYRGLLTVVLRFVFLLYAEERDMLPQDETYLRAYSLTGLYERLREDAARHPDTMDQRYGAWAQLIALSRIIHDGAKSGAMHLPPRHGELFDPDAYRFLEGRDAQIAGARRVSERLEPPLVPDGTIHRVLEKLIVLDGERISYRALDVEHVGAVYETMMGFRLETATGTSVSIKAMKRHGAPATVSLNGLLHEEPPRRTKWLQDRTDRKLTDRVAKLVRSADDLETLHAALDSVIDKEATPDLVSKGDMVLQPSEERRRSGSHYTPRELTEPIVREALRPILERLQGASEKPPRADHILDLKVCDPAMGSGAFLVEACRQLGDALIEAWHAHDEVPNMPPDEDEVVFARRMVARRCLYGVDRNPAAVDLAKLSLWLATAKEHPLTFLNHALRHGDSLVGLSKAQIRAFHWKEGMPPQMSLEQDVIRRRLKTVAQLRERIRSSGEDTPDFELRRLWDDARYEASMVGRFGNLALAAFFAGKNAKEREKHRDRLAGEALGEQVTDYALTLDKDFIPFHWQIEFPEVFDRDNPGFDAFIGNPPFAGKNTVRGANPGGYPEWLKELHAESHGNSDLVAHFFRRAFNLLREGGTFGLIATNTIAQGDTRNTGLRWICEHGGNIYRAERRFKWPGQAAVVVSVLHIHRGAWEGRRLLDSEPVANVTAFLFRRGGHSDPARLKANEKQSFQGSIVLGMGFTFDDTDKKGVATPLAKMRRLIAENPKNQEVIFPYIGGEEVNTSPTHEHHRYVINFHDYPLRRADVGESWEAVKAERRRELRRAAIVPLDYPGPVAADWPDLLAIIEATVRPQRAVQNRKALRERWWQYAEKRPGLYSTVASLSHVLVTGAAAVMYHMISAVPASSVFSHKLIVFPMQGGAAFAALQGRVHEIWSAAFGTTFGSVDALTYNPTKVFFNFPFPVAFQGSAAIESTGNDYHRYRAALMVKNNEGLTKTYNRFHDPNESSREIAKLRDLHTEMDRAVLAAYGWQDIPTTCEFLLDYPIDEAEWGNKKKPYRYRWPDDIRDEVLARLLELNSKRTPQ